MNIFESSELEGNFDGFYKIDLMVNKLVDDEILDEMYSYFSFNGEFKLGIGEDEELNELREKREYSSQTKVAEFDSSFLIKAGKEDVEKFCNILENINEYGKRATLRFRSENQNFQSKVMLLEAKDTELKGVVYYVKPQELFV